MLPPNEKLAICFAHVAYQVHERFSALDAGISSVPFVISRPWRSGWARPMCW
jgi:hypothetical protein